MLHPVGSTSSGSTGGAVPSPRERTAMETLISELERIENHMSVIVSRMSDMKVRALGPNPPEVNGTGLSAVHQGKVGEVGQLVDRIQLLTTASGSLLDELERVI